jgi:hypothetical protein
VRRSGIVPLKKAQPAWPAAPNVSPAEHEGEGMTASFLSNALGGRWFLTWERKVRRFRRCPETLSAHVRYDWAGLR